MMSDLQYLLRKQAIQILRPVEVRNMFLNEILMLPHQLENYISFSK